MREDLDKKLVQRYPLLYGDRHGNMRHTAMCWGFPGNGWYKLLNTLSYKLEGMIKKIVEENKNNPDARCVCGQKKSEHEDGTGKCLTIFQIPFFSRTELFRKWRRGVPSNWKKGTRTERFKYWFVINVQWKVKHKVNGYFHRVFNLLKKIGIYRRVPSTCEKYHFDHPRASQVKEKFGGLRFYLTCGTDEMYEAIRKAEEEADRTCERCGMPGESRGGGWIKTLCNRCNDDKGSRWE